jgi:hypothetical protein
MELGVQTHFSQGWNVSLLDKAVALGAKDIRDSQPWNAVEKTEGVYNFSTTLTNYMAKADKLDVGTTLTFSGANTLYDKGLTPYTAAGREAYADYIVKVLEKYGDTVEEVEIWNEFNGDNFVEGPATSDRATYYTELLKTVYETVKPLFPNVKILGGAAHSVSTGYLEDLFREGALKYMDAVALHPYRTTPEHLDDELKHLQAVMKTFGVVKPIYATEFGKEFANPADAPAYLIKMVTMMSAAHVAEASWYALQDQKYFPTMGLLASDGSAKPAAAAFAFAEKSLLPLGDAVQVEAGDDRTLIYRFGEDTYVMWGATRDVAVTAGSTVYDVSGHVIAAPSTLSMTPVIVKGGFQLGASPVIADSMLEYGEGAWRYFAKTPDGVLHELGLVDWDWTSYIGGAWYKPLRINADGLAPAGDGSKPIQAVERYTSTTDQTIEVTGTWKVGTTGDGIDLHILVNGKEMFSKVFEGEFKLSGLYLDLKAGDTVDFAVGPNQYVTGDSTSVRIQLLAYNGSGALSAATGSGTSGADTLVGTAAAEQMSGLAGADRLIGGGGGDTLTGGLGADRFVYQYLADSKGTGSGRDQIIDFNHAEGDKIDLSAIDAKQGLAGDQAFALVSYYTQSAGQLMVVQEAGGYTVKADVNGDGASDLMIWVGSKTSLVASDFIF